MVESNKIGPVTTSFSFIKNMNNVTFLLIRLYLQLLMTNQSYERNYDVQNP